MAHGLCVAFSDLKSMIWLVDDKLTMRVIRIQGVFSGYVGFPTSDYAYMHICIYG